MHNNRNVTSEHRKKHGQFFTPAWAAEILYDAHMAHLTEKDLLWEPMAGTGNMLAAVPAHVPAFGTEIDPELVKYAKKATGRNIIHGDASIVDLPSGISAIFSNPPFKYSVFLKLMRRAENILDFGNKAVFIIPAYFFQTSRTFVELYRNRWTVSQEMIPRDIFPGLIKPLIVASFIRENNAQLIGFRLFQETTEFRELPDDSQDMISNTLNGARSTWREVIKTVISELGGMADLSDIYKRIEGRRPTENAFWKEKIRQELQRNFRSVSKAKWALN